MNKPRVDSKAIRIVLATRNPGKAREIIATLDRLPVEIVSLAQIDPGHGIAEPEETGLTFAANARDKAHYYARALQTQCAESGVCCWALADDSGLEVDALNGQPGVYSARYAAEDCPEDSKRDVLDPANNAKLLRNLAGVDEDHRTARFVCTLALSDGQQILLESRGVIEGHIGHDLRGQNGFGYDPLFVLRGRSCTMAELPADDKNAISHRGQAVRNMAELLREYFK